MLYFNDKARESAIDNIMRCISAIGEVPHSALDRTTAADTIRFLNILLDEVEKEQKLMNDLQKASGSGKTRLYRKPNLMPIPDDKE